MDKRKMHRLATQLSMSVGLVILAIVAVAEDGRPVQQPTYSIDQIRGKVFRELPGSEERIREPSKVEAGSVLRTGWWSSAQIAAADSGALFFIESRTRVRLATGEPGVLVELQKGRLRALFEGVSAASKAERLVTTPSAVLAVRGTEYGVAVSKAGDTRLVVFSGVVEVSDKAGVSGPIAVAAGRFCDIPRGQQPSKPMPHSMDPGAWDRGQMPGSMSGGRSGGMSDGRGMRSSSGSGSMGRNR